MAQRIVQASVAKEMGAVWAKAPQTRRKASTSPTRALLARKKICLAGGDVMVASTI